MDLSFVEKKILKLKEELRLLKAVQQLISTAVGRAASEDVELVEKDGKTVAVIMKHGDATTIELLEPLDEDSLLKSYFYDKFMRTEYMKDVEVRLKTDGPKITAVEMRGEAKKLQTALKVARWCLKHDF